jgi:DNA-binding transcriptional LysR family regulator
MSDSSVGTLRLPKFDVRQVRAFLVVAGELHFGRAAERLFTSQPALSRTIHALEEAVGVALFERSTRRVRLTSAGEAFAAECSLALGHLERASTAAIEAADGRGGRLRVGYMDFAINGSLPSLLRGFRMEFPKAVVDLEYNPSSKQRVALLEGRIDMGFVIGEFESPKVLNMLVDQNDYVALLPDTHPLASRHTLRLVDLAEEPFVMGTEEAFGTFRRLLFPVCHTAGFFPNIVQLASNSSGIFGMVAAGVGVSVYAGCARNAGRAGVVVRPLADVSDVIPTFAVWVADNPLEVLHGFRKFLIANVRRRLAAARPPGLP